LLHRFEFSYSPSMLNQCSIPPIELPPKKRSTTQWDPLRRRSLGVLEQLESCHIANRESKDHVARRNSLPVAPSAIAPLPKAQPSWFKDSSYSSVQAVQPSSQTTSMPWWNGSRPCAQNNTVNFPNCRPLLIEDSASKKRRLNGDFQVPQAQRLSQSSQISPRTTPVSVLPNRENFVRNSVMDRSDMLWTPDLAPLLRTPPPNKPIFNSWSDFDWDTFSELDTIPCHSQLVHKPMPMDIPLPNLQTSPPMNSLHQSRIGQFEPCNIWAKDISRVPAASQVRYRPTFESAPKFHRSFQTSLHQAQPQNFTSQWLITPSATSSPCMQTVLSQTLNTTPRAEPNLVSRPHDRHAQNRQISISPSPSEATVQPPQPAPSDLLRKPSLYKIPAWPIPQEVKSAQTPRLTSQLQPRSTGSYTASSAAFQSELNIGTPQQQPDLMQFENHRSRNFENNSSSEATNTSSSTPHVTTTNTDTFEVPRARTGRKHCPNLYVRTSLLILDLC
jgi:hypothetical protein